MPGICKPLVICFIGLGRKKNWYTRSWRNPLRNCGIREVRYGEVRRGQLKCDGTRAETKLRLSEKRTSPFKSAGTSVQSTTGSRGVRISGSNAGYTMFRGSVKSTGYPFHSPVSPSLTLPCVTVYHHISAHVKLPASSIDYSYCNTLYRLQNRTLKMTQHPQAKKGWGHALLRRVKLLG